MIHLRSQAVPKILLLFVFVVGLLSAWVRPTMLDLSVFGKFGLTIKAANGTAHGSLDGKFNSSFQHSEEWFMTECFQGQKEDLNISSLTNFSERWAVAKHIDCKSVLQKFSDIYTVKTRAGRTVIPQTFQKKVLQWLGNKEDLLEKIKLQSITSVFNKYTHEAAIFNPLRSNKPVPTGGDDVDEYVKGLIEKSGTCDFCNATFMTSEDVFGRVESRHTITAANTFKYDTFHALILLKTHHPLRFTEEQFLDMFDVTLRWFERAFSSDNQYCYPHFMWDCLPKGGASQLHPHGQATLTPDGYYGGTEHMRLSAMEYNRMNSGQNYFADLIQIHSALGLTTSLGDATAMAYLTPKKDHDIMVISKNGGKDFFRLLYFVVRAFIDDMKLYAWSLSVTFPKMNSRTSNLADDMPAIARIISRGHPTNPVTDISSMELFGTPNVITDPFSLIYHIKESKMKRADINSHFPPINE